MALEERGYLWSLVFEDGRDLAFPRWQWIILYDKTGRQWSRDEALCFEGRIEPVTRARNVPDSARAFYGASVVVFAQRFKLPPRRGAPWRRVGTSTTIYYDRTGIEAGPFVHPWDPHVDVDKLAVGSRMFYRLKLGADPVIDERGFVHP